MFPRKAGQSVQFGEKQATNHHILIHTVWVAVVVTVL